MKRLLGVLALVCVSAGIALGQNFTVFKETSLSGAAEVITIQQPATGARTVRPGTAYLYCSAACAITIERNGAAATATALTVVDPNMTGALPKFTAWSGSNVGAGTVVGRIRFSTGGGFMPLDLSNFLMIGNGTTINLTLRTDAVTGIVIFMISVTES